MPNYDTTTAAVPMSDTPYGQASIFQGGNTVLPPSINVSDNSEIAANQNAITSAAIISSSPLNSVGVAALAIRDALNQAVNNNKAMDLTAYNAAIANVTDQAARDALGSAVSTAFQAASLLTNTPPYGADASGEEPSVASANGAKGYADVQAMIDQLLSGSTMGGSLPTSAGLTADQRAQLDTQVQNSQEDTGWFGWLSQTPVAEGVVDAGAYVANLTGINKTNVNNSIAGNDAAGKEAQGLAGSGSNLSGDLLSFIPSFSTIAIIAAAIAVLVIALQAAAH